jgi:adhesin transport system membrane fusion protein
MVVRGSGRIVASEHNQVIQHLEGGIVSAILVREGAAVKKGQTLISIADVRANADLGEGRVKILGLRAKIRASRPKPPARPACRCRPTWPR